MVTLTNTGTEAASFPKAFGFAIRERIGATSTTPTDCGTSLAPKASCQVSVFFKPLATGNTDGFFWSGKGPPPSRYP